jgi:ABC-type sugar transport system substrate-binding protein
MKKMIAAGLLFCAAALIAIPALAGTCPAPQCTVQTKAKSKAAGKSDYKVSCIEQSSGDEIISAVTAATEKEAKELASKKC